jgi:hypothetical protein
VKNRAVESQRVFKTAWFSKASAKANISDTELCSTIRQVMLGQCDDLGGGVFKKRLGKNLYRSIIVARGGRYWVYSYLFAKKDRANIDQRDLADLRALADVYSIKTDPEIASELRLKKIVEICHDNQAQIQE